MQTNPSINLQHMHQMHKTNNLAGPGEAFPVNGMSLWLEGGIRVAGTFVRCVHYTIVLIVFG